ncbi:MAG: hypothetical protein NZ954_07885 [Thermofilaceae archaeon]|nr:hypothetical protein [Thermofilaceae archaeon]MCX8179935.1 hypothetical protein [Thermofilaceae archaeon]MDW8004374.1 hypothetical protein [Thermofilaceae archaeon]
MDIRLRRAVEKAVEEFNYYHGAEAQVRIVEWFESGFKAEFRGSFCLSCGFYDYFDDFAQLVGESGYTLEKASIEEVDGGAVVEYTLQGDRVRREARQVKGVIFLFELPESRGQSKQEELP